MAPDLEPHRPRLTAHCYRMLGSLTDAEDAVQETLLRAWKARDAFDGRAAVGTWLHRIATNVCLDALSGRSPRWRPIDSRPVGNTQEELRLRDRTHWLEPVPDLAAIPADDDPHEQAVQREAIRLAFVAALQFLPPRQRAALLLMQVLNWSAAEVAETLEMSVAGVNSAVQRARATLTERRAEQQLDRIVALAAGDGAGVTGLTATQQTLVESFVSAFEAYDVPRIITLLRDDVTLCMPPVDFWLQGHRDVGDWLSGRGIGCKGSVLVPTNACGQVAFGQYRNGGAEPWALVVLELDDERITGMSYFLDTATLFPRFGLPMSVDPVTANPAA
ncbi:MAG: sigma-70 family RNA polymerase sigma factor [Gemmatimonadaceae bacterium]|nr:sigma-70 family RNA polymerase sigma factor [Gemmatimonadaceae bacterium]